MRKYVMITFLTITMMALAACTTQTGSDVAELTEQNDLGDTLFITKKQFDASQMILGKLEIRTFHQVVKATGIFDAPPENMASVSSHFGGTVKDLRLLPGQHVTKGQLLFTLENPDFVQMQQDYLIAKGQLAYLKSDYERQKNLVADKVTSQKNFLKAEVDYTVTSVTVASLGKKLLLMNIDPASMVMGNIRATMNVYAPINGYVTKVEIARGAYLQPALSAVTIVDTDHLQLELQIFEKDLPKVSIGQTIQFNIQDDNADTYAAKIHLVNKTIDPINRTILIHGHLTQTQPTAAFAPGMYVEAEIQTTDISKTTLPIDAIVELDGNYFALMLIEKTAEGYSLVRKAITIGEVVDDYTEVMNKNDFNEHTQFLIKGAFNLIKD